jgi:hypothetical protein
MVCLYLGDRCNSNCSRNAFKFVQTEFHEYFDCSEYDGKETVVFDVKELQIQKQKGF